MFAKSIHTWRVPPSIRTTNEKPRLDLMAAYGEGVRHANLLSLSVYVNTWGESQLGNLAVVHFTKGGARELQTAISEWLEGKEE